MAVESGDFGACPFETTDPILRKFGGGNRAGEIESRTALAAYGNQCLHDIGVFDAFSDHLAAKRMPELNESFFVNLGLRNTEDGKIERIATVRVDIIDDDLR